MITRFPASGTYLRCSLILSPSSLGIARFVGLFDTCKGVLAILEGEILLGRRAVADLEDEIVGILDAFSSFGLLTNLLLFDLDVFIVSFIAFHSSRTDDNLSVA